MKRRRLFCRGRAPPRLVFWRVGGASSKARGRRPWKRSQPRWSSTKGGRVSSSLLERAALPLALGRGGRSKSALHQA